MSTPRVFISATSGDLRTIRHVVKEALLTINCHPVEQTNFEPDWRTVEGMLRGKIADCQALIHVAGLRYGAEPDAASLPPGAPRRSYTQMEYALGRQLQEERGDAHFRVYTFLCPEDFPYDVPLDADGQPAAPEPEEKAQLQRAHRQIVLDDPHLREKPRSRDELQARVLALQEQVFAIRRQQEEVRQEVRGARRSILGVLALVVLLLTGIGGGLWWMNFIEKFDTPRIRAHFVESTERQRDTDLAAADRAATSDERQRLREAALAAHAARLARIDDAVARFAEVEGGPEATRIGRELTRILTGEGTDAALAFIGREKAGLLAAADAQLAADRERLRGRLAPLLSAADLLVTKGDTAAARTAYRELLQRDPAWPGALDAFAWFLRDQSIQNLEHRTLVAAFADAEEAHTLATRWHEAAPADVKARRLLSATHNQVGDVLLRRGQPGDAAQVEQHYTRCKELRERLLAANPGSVQAVRDVSVSLDRLGDFLTQRAQPGDAEEALGYCARSLELLEKLLAENPSSAEAVRDVSLSLDRLGRFLAQRGQPGDAAQALGHFTRSLELHEKRLAENPGSAQAVRDVSVSLERLGDFITRRGQPDDAAKVLIYCTRSLEIREKLLADNPGSAQAVRDVSISLAKLGDFLAERAQPGDASKALGHYTRCNELIEKLLVDNPGSAQAVRDVSMSLAKLGDFFAERAQPGDAEQTLVYYTRSLALNEKLLADNPGSGEAVRDVSVSLHRLGDSLARRAQLGDAEQALGHFTRSLAMREKLLADNPGSGEAVRDVSVSLEKLGDFLARRAQPGDAEQALGHFTRSLAVREKLLADNPGSAAAVRDVWVSWWRIADHAETTGKGDAKAAWRKAYDILDGMVRQGMFVSPGDLKFLETLRTKVGAK